MTNREWLNTLSGMEYVEAIKKYISPFTDWIGVNWLSQPHETTADEDFAEIGLQKIQEIQEKNEKQIRYFSDEFEVIVYKDETKIRIMPSPYSTYVLLENNQIRPIADKKRKEVWG